MKTLIRLVKDSLYSVVELDDAGTHPWCVRSGEQIGGNGTKQWSYNPPAARLTLFEYFATSAGMPAYFDDIAGFPPGSGSSGWGVVLGAPNPAFRGTVRWSVQPAHLLVARAANFTGKYYLVGTPHR